MTKRFARVPIAAAAMKGLGEHGHRVLTALGAFSNKAGQCFPSLATIAAVAKLDRRHVPAALAKLEKMGLIRRSRIGTGKSTSYTILYPHVSRHDVTAPSRPDVTGKAGGVTPRHDRVSRHGMTDEAESVTPRRALTAQDIEQPIERPTLLSPDGDSDGSEIGLAFEAWSAMAGEAGLPTIRKLTKPLRSSLKARLAEVGGIHAWQATIERVRQSEFLCGGGQSGWRCSLQWLVKPSNFEKVTSGNYDNRPGRRTTGSKGQAMQDALADLHKDAFNDR